MSEMVEKVARALCKQAGYGIGEDDWPVYVGAARAAIEAMREPTPEMLGNVDGWVTEGDVWRSMIDAALKD